MSSRAILAVELAERIALLEDELRRLPRTVWGVVVSIDPSVDVLIDGFGTPVREVALEIGRVAVGERVKVSAQGTSYTVVGVAGDARNERVDSIETGLEDVSGIVADSLGVLEDHQQTLEEIEGLVEDLNEHNTTVVDPFIQDADYKLSVELPAAQQAAAEAGNKALAAIAAAELATQANVKIESTRGVAFKNNSISTDLNVTVYYKDQIITDTDSLWALFGVGAYLEWWWRREDDDDFGLISSSDDRLSRGGFTLTVSPDDVDEQTTFRATLNA